MQTSKLMLRDAVVRYMGKVPIKLLIIKIIHSIMELVPSIEFSNTAFFKLN